MLALIFLCLLLRFPLLVSSFTEPSCFWRIEQNEDNNGLTFNGCLFTFGIEEGQKEEMHFIHDDVLYLLPTKHYQFALALGFALEEINKNPYLLPNLSLQIFPMTHKCDVVELIKIINILGRKYILLPNYDCGFDFICLAALTGPMWATSFRFGTFLQVFKFPQITYGPFHPVLSDRELFPYLYQMAPKDTYLALAMVSLMLHFQWNWVGLTISDDDQGIQFLSDLRREMEGNRICLAFVNMIPVNMQSYLTRATMYYNQIVSSSANVVIIYGNMNSTLAMSFRRWEHLGIQRILVTTSQWDMTISRKEFFIDSFCGTLSFSHYHDMISGFKTFVQTLNPSNYTDLFLATLGWMSFDCEVYTSLGKVLDNYTSKSFLKLLRQHNVDIAISDDTYNLYNAVHAVAHALHESLLQHEDNQVVDARNVQKYYCGKLNPFLKKIQFINPLGDHVDMNQHENSYEEYDIFNIWSFPQGLRVMMKIGKFNSSFPYGQHLYLSEDMMEWATGSGEVPPSVCSATCSPGFRKSRQEGKAACCFECIPCPENEISNETDMDQCVKCPDDHYANEQHKHCLQKTVSFLEYEDPLGMALAFIALFLSLFTALVFGVFVKYQDTPIVKANNRTLSYILLISLTFCFLCSLLFIGLPSKVTCILQQMIFGVVFTIAISTVLAKTITVVLAFKFTDPGGKMRWLLVSGAPNFIIPICTLIQLIICGTWLGISPPFVDKDAHSEHGHIIVVCNAGSVIAFHCVLGYLGFLALGSFIVSFLVRNLPDTFNEAKFLTFSMLVFCSVWITFLPVYHSTRGKAMVAVEVFSILTSSAGLLMCIFAPKCYIILLKPERNFFRSSGIKLVLEPT